VAVAAAGRRSISIAGGASCARQAIAAGIVDKIDLQVNPVILGSGERFLDGFEAGEPALELVRVLEAPGGAPALSGYAVNQLSLRLASVA
jgi:dihydrofolate reductase